MNAAQIRILFLTLFLTTGSVIPNIFAHDVDEDQETKNIECFTDDASAKIFFKQIQKIFDRKDELSLSEEQIVSLKDLKIKTQKSLIMKEAEIKVNELDINSQINDDKWEAEILNGLIDKKFDLKKEEAKILLNAFVTLKTTLTQEQEKMLRASCVGKEKSKMMCPMKMRLNPSSDAPAVNKKEDLKKDIDTEMKSHPWEKSDKEKEPLPSMQEMKNENSSDSQDPDLDIDQQEGNAVIPQEKF